MSLEILKIGIREKPLKSLLVQSAAVLLISFILAKTVTPFLWVEYTGVTHTVFELLCIFTAISTFFVVWHTYDGSSLVNQVIGFGFLIVAAFDILHTYFHPSLGFCPPGYYDLCTRLWLFGRLTEVIVLVVATFGPFSVRVNKWAGLVFSAAFIAVVSYLIVHFPGLLPMLFTEQGLTPAKITLEYIIIALLLLGLYNLRTKLNSRDVLTYRYIFLALLIAIPTELCFTLYETYFSFSAALGHILKVVYYYYLFRGIFVSTITYPYEKLEQTGKYMNNILNSLPIGLTTYDSNFRLSFANQKAQELLGRKLEEIHGLSIEQMIGKFSGFDNLKELSLAKQTSRDPIKDKVRVVKNRLGEEIKLNVEGQQLEIGGFLYLFEEAKKAQELEDLKLQTQTIMNSVSNLILILDKCHRVITCNTAFENTTEMKADDILSMDLENLYNYLRFNKKEQPIIQAGGDWNHAYEASIITPKGNKKDLIVYFAPIFNVEGELIGHILTASDVTFFKKEQQKLQQQEKLAVLGQMAAGIVHEIKNPLTAIKGFSEIIFSKTENEQIKNYARIIESEALSVNKVVSDFLAFAKPRPPVLYEVSLNTLLQSIKLMLETHSFITGIDIKLNLAKEEKTVLADEAQIKQVVLNIAKNAFDAMVESKNPQLIITTGLNEATGEMFMTITDNGKGMSLDEKLKVGTPFFSTKDKGTGLGLSVCYQIIKEHNGRIEFESTLGKGTSFTISLPCKTETAETSKSNRDSLLKILT